MNIILDAMGGDLAPEAPVMAAVEAAKLYGMHITLVGRGEEILEVLNKHGIQDLPENLEISHADDVVDMHDDPASVPRKRKNSSMVMGLQMLAKGEGDAFVSAGSTGALLTGATLIVKRVKGIRRAAMGPAMPNKAGGKTVICDCGANAECTPEFLLQFGLVGSAFVKKQFGGGCGGLRRFLRKCAAQIHRRHRHVHGQPDEAQDLQAELLLQDGLSAVQGRCG